MPGNEEAVKKLDIIQNAIKNNKKRQHIQSQVAGDTDSRVGIGAPGGTRWSSSWKQMDKQLKLKGAMRNSTEDDEWKGCFDDDETAIIRDHSHWEKIWRMKGEAAIFNNAMKKFQGIVLYFFSVTTFIVNEQIYPHNI